MRVPEGIWQSSQAIDNERLHDQEKHRDFNDDEFSLLGNNAQGNEPSDSMVRHYTGRPV
jgi:hypothetical protein